MTRCVPSHGVGACMVGGHACWEVGRHVWQGACIARGPCVAGGCACHTHTHTLRDTASQCAGGMYPTGMHSCIQRGFYNDYVQLNGNKNNSKYLFLRSFYICL